MLVTYRCSETVRILVLLAISLSTATVSATNWVPQNMAWVLGPNGTSIRSPDDSPQPTGMTWSIVPGGTERLNSSHVTQDITDLGALGLSDFHDYQTVLRGVIDSWSEVSGIQNLGYIEEDGSVMIGDASINSITDRGFGSGVGHIRFMAYDSPVIPTHVYASASFIPEPGTQVDNQSNISRAGDIRFRSDAPIWGQGNIDAQRFRNIALHELGHILGFGHNSISDSVMAAPYSEWDLGTGDIEGAIAIYGLIPEPTAIVMLIFGGLCLPWMTRHAARSL